MLLFILMKTCHLILFHFIILLTGCGIFSTKPVTTPPTNQVDPLDKLNADIDKILQNPIFTTASISIKVVSVESGDVLYTKNAQKLHHPASTTKLFTAATSLAKLGPNYRFITSLYADTITDARIIDNIYLKGKGDPILQTEDLKELCDALVQTGVKTVRGDIVVDETFFDTVREGPGWMWDDKPFHISALSIRNLEPDKHAENRAMTCGHFLKDRLTQEGVSVKGNVVSGKVPTGTESVAEHLSPPLSYIVKSMNKPSDNWIAEMLFKTIGAEVIGEPGTWQKGREAIGEFLNEITDGQNTFRFVDGSGLSRYNLLNTELLTKLLVYMYNNFELMPEFTASLPIAGVDGTLRNRMQGLYAEKVLRAKTGTLSGVSALAGYTRTADGKVLTFGILISHYVGSSATARRIQDSIGDILTKLKLESYTEQPLAF